MEVKVTKVWVILNEESLQIVKKRVGGNPHELETVPMLFRTEKQADDYASHFFEIWIIAEVNFQHQFIHHEPNMDKYEKDYKI